MIAHKLWLGSTALASVGLLMSGAQAQETERVGGIEVVLGGFTQFGVVAGDKNTLTGGGHDRSYGFYTDPAKISPSRGAPAARQPGRAVQAQRSELPAPGITWTTR
ncbi:MAG: hypothetical protein ACREJ0_17780 [Geminicoccaceae bacterium]